jgi:hypothetical protein
MRNAKCRMKKKFEPEAVGTKAFEQEAMGHREEGRSGNDKCKMQNDKWAEGRRKAKSWRTKS